MTRFPLSPAGKRRALHEEAARLHLRHEEGGRREDLDAAQAWLNRSPEHGAAFQAVRETWDDARDVASSSEILSLRQETTARLASRRSHDHRRALAASFAAILISISTVVILHRGGLPQTTPEATADRYATAIGERLTVELADRSKILLNTNSQVRVSLGPDERRVSLDAGEAYFTVAKDSRRPFRVLAAGHAIVAYGTAFDVRIDGADLRVGLVEGQVGVRSARREVRMTPNNLLVIANGRVSLSRLHDARSLTSWSEGLITFDDAPVAEAVSELNRYLTKPIVLADASIGRTRISGTFRTGESEGFIEALGYYLPIERKVSTNAVILERR